MVKKAKDKEEGAEQFDARLEQLRETVERLEQGDLSLDESLKAFEEGIVSARRLFDILNKSEGKVEELLSTMERSPLAPAEE